MPQFIFKNYKIALPCCKGSHKNLSYAIHSKMVEKFSLTSCPLTSLDVKITSSRQLSFCINSFSIFSAVFSLSFCIFIPVFPARIAVTVIFVCVSLLISLNSDQEQYSLLFCRNFRTVYVPVSAK